MVEQAFVTSLIKSERQHPAVLRAAGLGGAAASTIAALAWPASCG
jgi:hypothetical protein